GGGRMRGGLGQRIELSASSAQDLLLFLSVERVQNAARGRHGGLDGAPGRIRLGQDGPDLPGKGEIRILAGETLVFETPGGGGFGPFPASNNQEYISRKTNSELDYRYFLFLKIL
ncbi:MAG: hydantoinase B/oxoprolinase family protein, partial [Verrucomicrobiota bacterium]